MLTKEQSDKLRDLIAATFYNREEGQYWHNLQSYIEKITEKTKRKVKVGDMYRDGRGKYETVTEVLDNYFRTNEDCSYDFNGNFGGKCTLEKEYLAYYRENFAHYKLDLSKLYKIVEVEDE